MKQILLLSSPLSSSPPRYFTFLSLFPHFKIEITLELLRGLSGVVYRVHSAQWLDHSMHSLLTIVIFSEKSNIFGELLPPPVM